MDKLSMGLPVERGRPVYTSRQLGKIISLITGETDHFWIAGKILDYARRNGIVVENAKGKANVWIRLDSVPEIVEKLRITSLDGMNISSESIESMGRYLAYHK